MGGTRCLCYLTFLAGGLGLSVGSASGEIKEFSPQELANVQRDSEWIGQKVQTRGTILWINPYWPNCFIAQESSSQGINIELASRLDYMELELGQEVVVEGVVAQSLQANLDHATFEVLGPGVGPEPLPIKGKLDLESLREFDRQLVVVEGKVGFSNQHFDRYVIWIEGYGLPVCAEFREKEKRTVGLQYAGATVRITGVSRLLDGGEDKLKLSLQSAEDVEILQPGPQWPSDQGGRGTNGIIVCRKSDNRYFFRADDKEFLELDIFDCQYLHVGDMARFVGTEFEERSGIRRVDVAGIEIHQSSTDWTLNVDIPDEMGVAEQHSTGDWTLAKGAPSVKIGKELQQGWFGLTNPHGETIRVEVAGLVGDIDTLQLNTATKIEAIGYLDMDPNGAILYPRDMKDLKVVERLPWYRSSRVQGLVVGLLATLVLSLVTVALLRKAVKRGVSNLQESTGLLNASYDAILEGICLVDEEGKIRNANPRFWELLNLDPKSVRGLAGEALRDLLANQFHRPAEFAALWDAPFQEGRSRKEQQFERRSGSAELLSVYSVSAYTQGSNKKLGRVWVLHDMTEQHRLEQSLLQAQKMEAVGRLAGGIAHDFNNMLAGISGNLEIIKLKLDETPEQSRSFIEAAEYGVGRAAQLVKGLLGFSRQTNLEVKPGSANEVIEALLNLVKPTLDPKYVLEAKLAAELGLAAIDAVQLEQVLLNLLVNARDAMAPDGGTIYIQTRNVEASKSPGEAKQECIEISVTDTGSGMSAETAANVFDPFFSTKEPGQGTGLGLATSQGVIQQHHGWITCESVLGHGTVFSVFLPRIRMEVASPSEHEQSANGLTKNDRSLLVLCVDDEEFVRQSAEAILQALGHETCSAENGEQALELLAEASSTGEKMPDVVLLDQAMPLLSGVETLPLLRERYPELPVVLCTGFLADLDEFAEQAGSLPDGFVQKPYQGQQLQATLEQVVSDKLDLVDSAGLTSNRGTR